MGSGKHLVPPSNAKLDQTLTSIEFQCSDSEHAVYACGVSNERLPVGVYVDDLVITGNNSEEIDIFKSEMKHLFKMSDLGLLHFYLCIEVQHSADGISLSQATYARQILKKAGTEGRLADMHEH